MTSVRPRALVLAPQPFFSPRGTPLSVYYRSQVMTRLGVSVDLLTYGEGVDPCIEGVRIVRIPRFRLLGRVKTGPSFVKAFLDVFMLIWSIGLLVRHRYDFVHAHEEAVFFAAPMKALFRYRLVYDMHSSLPEQLSNFGFSNSRVLRRLFEALERYCLGRADAVITICPALAEYATSILDDDAHKHFLIENSIVDPIKLAAEVESNGSDHAENALDVPWKQRVVYAGTLERYQGVDLLVGGFAKVASRYPDAGLVIVGGSDEQVAEYSKLARELGLDGRCIFIGRVPPDRARAFNRSASVLVSPRSAGTNTPLKIYEQLASGIPLLATNIRSHTQVLDDRIAMLVAPTADGVASGLSELLSDEYCGRDIARRARAKYEEAYARPVYEGKMARLLELVR